MMKFGIYVHVPFCEKKCAYCDFLSAPPESDDTVRAYFEALDNEIEEAELPEDDEDECTSIYFGGGTPSFVDVDYIDGALDSLGGKFHFDTWDENIEKTVEVNPASAVYDKLKKYRDVGFNRLSVGLQAKQDRLLKTLGRVHSLADFEETLEAAEKAKFNNVSVDLMFGLPGQTLDDVEESVEYVLGFPIVKHLSCYSLSVEPGTAFESRIKSGELVLPAEDLERDMYHTIQKMTAEKGMDQYEISNFAYPGYESRHNIGYWTLTPYYGFGVGASAFDYRHSRRFSNTKDLGEYLDAPGEKLREDITLTEENMKGDFMYLGLRRLVGVDDADYREMFGSSFFDDYKDQIDKLLDEELIEKDDSRIFLSAKGLDLANQVFMEFV